MKRLKTTIPNGGSPLGKYPVIREIFDTETKDAIEALLSTLTDSLTEGVILSGCVASGTSPTAALTAGYAYLGGKVLRVPAATGQTYPFYIGVKTPTTESDTFADSVSKAWIDVEEAEVVSSVPGAGQYVTIGEAGGGLKAGEVIRAEKSGGDVLMRMKVLEIGDWNMDTTASVNIAHGVDKTKVRSITALIRDDSDLNYYNLDYIGAAGAGSFKGVRINSANITLFRGTGDPFDNTSFDATTYNRGWVTIWYEA
jgi:hypothetical protein